MKRLLDVPDLNKIQIMFQIGENYQQFEKQSQ